MEVQMSNSKELAKQFLRQREVEQIDKLIEEQRLDNSFEAYEERLIEEQQDENDLDLDQLLA